MIELNKLNLQLFAEGGECGDGGTGVTPAAAGQDTGVNSAAAERDELLKLGVPENLLNKRAKYRKSAEQPVIKTEQPAATEQAAAAEEAAPEPNENTPPLSWDEIKANPIYNAEIQKIVSARTKKSNEAAQAAEAKYASLAPMLEVLATKYGLDPNNFDPDALSKAVVDDDSFYEDRAMEMGVPTEVAKRLANYERQEAQTAAEQQRRQEQDMYAQHFAGLEQQAAEMQKIYPNFDLRTELNDPRFARMTAPGGGLSVADAYFAIHREEIMSAGMQAAEKRAAENIANNIRAGQNRPSENGTTSRGATPSTFNYAKASPEQRAAFKQELRSAWARGEKVYPR